MGCRLGREYMYKVHSAYTDEREDEFEDFRKQIKLATIEYAA
jgi:hypothetical protein